MKDVLDVVATMDSGYDPFARQFNIQLIAITENLTFRDGGNKVSRQI